MGAVSGTVNSVLDGNLALGGLGFTNESINSDKNTPFNQSSNLVLTGLTGTQSITLGFQWSSNANLPDKTLATGNDEVAVRLGIAGTASRVSAENYPGLGSRNINGDGHFVTIEPGPFVDGLQLPAAVGTRDRFEEVAVGAAEVDASPAGVVVDLAGDLLRTIGASSRTSVSRNRSGSSNGTLWAECSNQISRLDGARRASR